MAKKAFKLADNPLVNPPNLPQGAPALDKIKTAHFVPAIEWALQKAEARIAAIKANPDPADFANTIEALAFADEELGRVMGVFSNQVSTLGDDKLRDIQIKIVGPKLARYGSAISFDEDLFARVKQVYDNRAALNLSQEQKMLLENSYKGFVRSGALLAPAQKKRLAEISEELSRLSSTYNVNVIKASELYSKLIEDENDLAGVPEDIKDNYKARAEAEGHKGKWLIKLMPPPTAIMSHAENRTLREEIWRKMGDIATSPPHDNKPVVLEIIKLRDEKAKILGYPNYAEYVLSDRMAGSAKAVNEFLAKNLKAYKPAAQDELRGIETFAWKLDSLKKVEPWDYGFYNRKLKEQTFKINMEEVKAYFELDKVLDGLFQHSERLFDIKISQTNGKYPVHNSDVNVYELHDRRSGDLIGVFYADYFARPGAKRGGAWMTSFRSRGLENGTNQVPLVINVCNFAKPPAGKPALLSLDEVRTLFHEFGHGLHGLLAKGDYPSLTGTSVKWDFVELPSQLMENWALQKEVLSSFAVHNKTGQRMPPSMMRKLGEMSSHGAGYMGLRQTGLAMLDMGWHTADPGKISDAERFEQQVMKPTALFAQGMSGPMSTHFSHIFAGGYAAGYYSYKWAEVLDADVFARFEQKGLYHRGTAADLRRYIYERGGTEPPMTLFRKLMGRDPDPQALFRRDGLINGKGDQKSWPPRSKPRPPGPGA